MKRYIITVTIFLLKIRKVVVMMVFTNEIQHDLSQYFKHFSLRLPKYDHIHHGTILYRRKMLEMKNELAFTKIKSILAFVSVTELQQNPHLVYV
jgi:hypothetical protein